MRRALVLIVALGACGKSATKPPVPDESGSGSGSGGAAPPVAAEVPAGDEPPGLVLTVQGDIAGTTPDAMDTLFARPMLAALAGIPHLASTITRTTGGHSVVVMRFDPDVDSTATTAALQALLDDPEFRKKVPAVDHAGWMLGDPAYPSVVLPILGGTASDRAAIAFELGTKLPEVRNVDSARGHGPRLEAILRLDLAKAQADHVTVAALIAKLQQGAPPASPQELADVVVAEPNGVAVKLKDLATVEQGLDPYTAADEAPSIAIWVHPGESRDRTLATVREYAKPQLPGMTLGPRIVPTRMPLLLVVATTDGTDAAGADRAATTLVTALKSRKLIFDSAPVPAATRNPPIAYTPDPAKLVALQVDALAFRKVRRALAGEPIAVLGDRTAVVLAPPDRVDEVTVESTAEGAPLVPISAFASTERTTDQIVRLGPDLATLVQLEPAKGKTLADLQAVVAQEAAARSPLHAVVLQP